MAEIPIEIHKALADATRYKLYRYLRLSDRPVPIRDIATRLSLHPNTLRPHLRRLEEVGLVTSETGKTAGVGRPQALYMAAAPEGDREGDYHLILEILLGVMRGKRSVDRVEELAREWGGYLLAHDTPKPGSRLPASRNLAALQRAMARAGFDPRFRRVGKRQVEVILRECPARDLVDENRDIVCALHRGLIEGMLEGVRPSLDLIGFEPLVERTRCRVVAEGAL